MMIPSKVKAPVSLQKFTNVSKNTTQVVLSIKNNILCKEGMFSDVLGDTLTRNKKQPKHFLFLFLLVTENTRPGVVAARTWGGSSELAVFPAEIVSMRKREPLLTLSNKKSS